VFFVQGAKCVIVAVSRDDARLRARPESQHGISVGALRKQEKERSIALPPTYDLSISSASLRTFPDDVRLFLLFEPGTKLFDASDDQSSAVAAALTRRKAALDEVTRRRDAAREDGDANRFRDATSERDTLVAEAAHEAGGRIVPKLVFEFDPDAPQEIAPSIYLVDLTVLD
jgi:hypothetical protein